LLHGKDALSPLSLTAQRRASAQRCSSPLSPLFLTLPASHRFVRLDTAIPKTCHTVLFLSGVLENLH